MPKLIVVDLTMPVMDGLSFLRWLRKESPPQKMPAVVLSGSHDGRQARLAFADGCEAFFVKPTDATHLEEIVQQVHERWLQKSGPAQV